MPKSNRLNDFLILIIFVVTAIDLMLLFSYRNKGEKERIAWKFDAVIQSGELKELNNPVVHNNSIYLAINTKGRDKSYIVAVNQDGKEKWRREFEEKKEILEKNYEVRILGFSDPNVYIQTPDGNIEEINSQDGKTINKYEYEGSGFYKDGLIYSVNDGYINTINSDNGTSKWQFNVPENIRFSGLDKAFTYDSNNLFLETTQDSNDDGQIDQVIIACLDLVTGQQKWSNKFSLSDVRNARLHLFNNNLIYGISSKNEIIWLDPNSGEISKTVKLQNQANDISISYSFFIAKNLYFTQEKWGNKDTVLNAFNEDTGKLKWTYDLKNNRVVGIQADDVIYVSSVNDAAGTTGTGRGKIDAINPVTGEKIWHLELGIGDSISKPILSNDKIYFTAGDYLKEGEFLYALYK